MPTSIPTRATCPVVAPSLDHATVYSTSRYKLIAKKGDQVYCNFLQRHQHTHTHTPSNSAVFSLHLTPLYLFSRSQTNASPRLRLT